MWHKCPFSAKERTLHERVKESQFCLTGTEEGMMSLKLHQSYMYHMQAHKHIAEVIYCDFLAWTPKGPFIPRILFDGTLFLKVVNLIRIAISPELLGKWFTVPRLSAINL